MYDVRHMKRIFAVISINALLWSTGCTAVPSVTGKTANPMTGSFSAEVTVKDAELESKAILTRYGADAWCIEFSEPQTLAGVQLEFLDDEVKASYKGLEFSVPQTAQTVRTELEELMQVIDDMALSPDLNGKAEENKIICEGSVEEGNYTMTFTDTGIPEEFSLPCYGLTVQFENFHQQTGTLSETETVTETMTESIPAETEETTEIQEAMLSEPVEAEQAAVIEATIPE